MNWTLDEVQSLAELMRATQGRKIVHYLPHGANPKTDVLTGMAVAFRDGLGHVPHKDAPVDSLMVELQVNGAKQFVAVPEMVSAVQCGRFYIDGDLSHAS